MIVKTFRGATMEEALAKVKAALGDDVLIIDTRTVAPRGLFGFLRQPVVEVIVGVEDAAPPRPARSPQPVTGSWGQEAANLRALEREIGEIKHALRLIAKAPDAGLDDPFLELQVGLLEGGLDEATAADLVEACQGERGRPAERLRAVLARRFRTAAEPPPAGGNHTRGLAVIGPPGAGKTTLLAKLAGRFSIERGERVVLVTVDFFRVGAVEQLKAYAEILDLPFHYVSSPDEVPRVLEAARPAAWLLVDTPGLPHHDVERLAELAACLGAFPSLERHLVVAATTDRPVALASIAAYRDVGFERLAFTRLDEARRHGLLLVAAAAAGVPVSYLGEGQDVARDLAVAAPDRLADLVLGGLRPEGVKAPTRGENQGPVPGAR